MTSTLAGPERPLSRDRDFLIFWLVQTLSVGGASFSYVAIPLLVLDSTGSVSQMGLLTGVSGAAGIVAGIFAGGLVDRVDRRRLLIWCDAVRAPLYALVPLVWWGGPQLWLLYVIMPLGSAVAMVFQVGYVSAVPSLVPAARITQANGRLFASYASAGVVGPMLAGGLSALLGPAAAIGVDAATFAASALGLCLVRLRRPGPAPAAHPAGGGRDDPVGSARADAGGDRSTVGRRPVTGDLLVGARFLWRQPVLRALTGRLALLTFLTFGLTDLYVYHLKQGLGRSDATVGYVLAVAALGTVAAALLVAPARRRLGFGVCWIGSYAFAGTGVVLLAGTADARTVAALAAVVVFGTSLAGICSLSLRQEITPDPLLGRVTSAFWTVHTAPGPLGAALFTAAAGHWGTARIFLLIGVGCLLVAGSAVATPIGRSRIRLPRQA
ncbi:putative MFS family arabinose efflux permease [Micromonospora pisi]|uniref:Putative MFS family arabinose efflux permease n=1 Tax=Micromonospora pisi TaxID=589240 RepID=A0A495JAG1_9ACTN|nr:MFS transporter [Micromonospora pisi]RKR85813.1 putative MFS family arabinose efflux permease [Micromonospora pisi]